MLRAFIDFKPAQYVETKKESYVAFYAMNPFTERLERKRIRLNHIRLKKERRKYGNLLALEINDKLYRGWNPFVEELKANGCPTIKEAFDEFLKVKSKSVRDDSMRTYRSFVETLTTWVVVHGMENKLCATFTNAFAGRFMRAMEEREDISAKTYNNYLSLGHVVFGYFQKKKYVPANPFDGMERKRVDSKSREIIPPEDRKRIADYFIHNNMYEYLIVMQMCYRLFIRPKEIMMLKIGYVNFNESLLTIPADVAKNHKERTLGVPKEIMEYLNKLQDYDKRLYIFSEGYKPGKKLLGTHDTSRTWKQMRDELKLPASYKFYSLKDTGITEMLEAGVPAKYVKELADHHSLEMTERYTHKSEAKKILEWNKLEF